MGCQYGNEGAGLNGSCVDQVRFDLTDKFAKIPYQSEQVAPFKGSLSAIPKYLVNPGWHRAVFGLPVAALQAYVKNIMFRFRQGGKKTMVVRGIVEREINYFHQAGPAKKIRVKE